MQQLVRRFYLVMVCLLCVSLQPTCYADTTRAISRAQWEQLKNDEAFGYKKEKELIIKPEPYKPSPLNKFFDAFFKFFDSGPGRTLIWLFILSIAGYIIYRVFFSKDSFLFGKNKKIANGSGALEENTEDISTTDWEALLQQATNNNDLRLAVRYSYMWLLQMLQKKELIRYRNDKTNYDYYTELEETSYKQSFRQLSRQYEYTWYGRFTLPHAAFNDYLALFNNVKNQLGS